MLNSFFPLFSISEDPDLDNEVILNKNSIEFIDNNELNDYSKNIDFINLMFWIVILIGVISFIGLIIFVTDKFVLFSILILIFGCLNIIFLITATFSGYGLIDNVINSDIVNFAYLFNPLAFIYINLLLYIAAVFFSLGYFIVVVMFSIKQFRLIKEKTFEEETKSIQIKNSNKKGEVPSDVKSFDEDFKDTVSLNKKRSEFNNDTAVSEDLLKNDIGKNSEKDHKADDSIVDKNIINDRFKLNDEKVEDNLKVDNTPFSIDRSKDVLKDEPVNEINNNINFEKVLYSAIDKKQSDRVKNNSSGKLVVDNKNGPAEKQVDIPDQKNLEPINDKVTTSSDESIKDFVKNNGTKKFNVRCPQCQFVFIAEINSETKKIKCPKCGKEGIIN